MYKILINILFLSISFTIASASEKDKNLDTVVSLISSLSETVHSLQQERGASCGYVSSSGAKFGTKLKEIKTRSDKQIDKLDAILEKNHNILEKYISDKQIYILEKTFKNLSITRDEVQNLKINFVKTYSRYTQSISFMLLQISNISDKLENEKLSDNLYVYSTLLMYKESIGQKRAVLRALFSKKDFDKEIFEFFLTSSTQEKIYLKSFLHGADDNIKKLYAHTLDNKATKQVKKYEKLALEKLAGKTVNVDPEKWFNVVTKKINLVQKVEHKLFENILVIVDEINANLPIALTKEEKRWIQTHTLKVGVEQWNPVVFSNTGKDIDGIAGDFTKKIVASTGLKLEIINDNWDKLLLDFKDKKIDILPATYYTSKRAKFGLYSDAYFKMKDSIYVKNSNSEIKSLKDLEGKTLAIPAGYGTIEKLQKAFPKVKLVFTHDLDDSINRVLNGRVTAFYEGQIAADTKINNELIKGLKSIAVTAFKAPGLHYFTKMDEPILQSIIQKALHTITYKEKNKIINNWAVKSGNKELPQKNLSKQEVSFIGLIAPEELTIIGFFFLLLSFGAYKLYRRSNVLDVKLKTFIKIIVFIELLTILFLIYEIMLLDRTENLLATSTEDSFQMIQLADKLRQSSDDLTHFARTYAVTQDKRFKKRYFDTLKIRNGELARPVKYRDIYWDLKKEVREKRHPVGEKISLKALIQKLPYSEFELNKLKESKNNSDDLVNIEAKAFKAIKNNNAEYAIKTLHSRAYYDAKHKIMLPIDEMMNALYERTNRELKYLNQKIQYQFVYIVILGLLFVLGNIFLYIILSKKFTEPIEYLTDVIKQFQNNNKEIIEKRFYHDEIGMMNSEFFLMKETIDRQTKDLHKQLRVVRIAERKQQGLLEDIEKEKQFTQTLLDSQEQLIITTDGKKLLTANKTFFNFFAVDNTQDFMDTYDSQCICNTFNTEAPKDYLQIQMGSELWIDYVISRPFNMTHKAMVRMDNIDFIFSVTAAELPGEDGIKSAVFTDITAIENAKQEIEAINKHIRESIEYASLIQGALIPDNKLFRNHFQDYFAIWHPKDTVGGDIYLFEELRDKDECLLMVIDCMGHGVPGAFVTMLVKAIERQIISKINNDPHEVISPAKILSIFNKNMKQLLKQENNNSISNAGFDGGIIYYNKKEKILKFAGAETPLFYMEDNEFKTIKGDRYSVGYKKCDMNYEYKEHIVEVKEGVQFYLTTDGYLDQNGGVKSFPLGKKAFKKIIEENHVETMADQQEVFLYELDAYQGEEEANDDVTVIGLRI